MSWAKIEIVPSTNYNTKSSDASTSYSSNAINASNSYNSSEINNSADLLSITLSPSDAFKTDADSNFTVPATGDS